ncbi:MAG: PAS domain S-box protein [Gammaproteobacteria bacterium]|nr:MAG: PAS domain S-box protein [Gammaproteobacteria bacterium]
MMKNLFHVGIALFLLGIFALDLNTPLGFADGVLYVIPVLLALRGNDERLTLNVALLGAVLVLAGQYLSPPGNDQMTPVLFNRSVAFLAIWATAWLGILGARKDRHLRNMIETVNEGVITINDEGRILEFNPAAERTFGYRAAEIQGKNVKLLMPDPYSSAHDGYLKRYRETGEARVIGFVRELTGVRKNGAIFPLELTLSEMRRGRKRLFTGLVRDIEDRRRTERELQRNAARLELAQHIAGLGFYETDWGTGETYWSDEIYRIYDLDNTGGKPDFELIVARIHPEDRPKVLEAIERSRKTGGIYDDKHRLITRAGEIRHVHVRGGPHPDPASGERKLFGTIMDITDRERQIQTIARYHDIVDATDELMMFIDCDYVYRAVNTAFLKSAKKSREEVIGRTVCEIMGKDFFMGMAKAEIDRCLQGESLHIQHWMKSFDAGEIFLDIHFNPSMGSSGSIDGVVINARDETERKNFEVALENAKVQAETANRTRAQFLASMSHELHTPLTAIIGYSEMLRDQAEEDGRTQTIPDLENIRKAGVHLLTLIDNILDTASLEAGQITLYPRRFKLREMLDEAGSAAQASITEHGNSFALEIAPDVDTMTTDPFRLRQCLIHLLDNAAKFTSRGEIRLGVRAVQRHDKWLEFSVSDTGSGMTAEQLQGLFKAAPPQNGQANTGVNGPGLGLVIVHGLVKLMGGEIRVTSEAGKGSCFTISLPAY